MILPKHINTVSAINIDTTYVNNKVKQYFRCLGSLITIYSPISGKNSAMMLNLKNVNEKTFSSKWIKLYINSFTEYKCLTPMSAKPNCSFLSLFFENLFMNYLFNTNKNYATSLRKFRYCQTTKIFFQR